MFSHISSEIRGGFLRWKRQYMNMLPIASATDKEKSTITSLVRRILSSSDSTYMPALEADIDHLIYGLYKLTPEEITLVENSQRKQPT